MPHAAEHRHSIPSVTTDSGAPQPPPDVIFRRSARRRFFGVLCFGTIGLLLLLGLAATMPLGYKAASGAAALVFAYLAIRAARAAIVAEADHLVVRDMHRTYRIGWREIARFETPPSYGTWRKAGLRIHLIDGQMISVIAYAQGLLDTGRPEATVVRELERLRRQRSRE
jgi:hypothetical protein